MICQGTNTICCVPVYNVDSQVGLLWMLGPHGASPPAALNPAEQELFQMQAAATATLVQQGGFHANTPPPVGRYCILVLPSRQY
jgi:phenylpropionate dioxygenase-like ring-hydroxylating dioxygenase large terminal subunit